MVRLKSGGLGFAGLVAGTFAAMAAIAAPAWAQDDFESPVDEQDTEIYCVYDVLSQSGDLYDIADVFVDDKATDKEIEAADELLNDAIDECLDVYDWDDSAQEYAALIGIHGSVVDVLTTDLSRDGVSEAGIEAIFQVLEELNDDDVAIFSDASWLDDRAFNKRMNRALIAAGVPDEDFVLENSMLVMESSVLAAQAVLDWLDLLGTDASAAAEPSAATPAGSTQLAATGTGFYVAPEGYLVTNAHVVEGCKQMTLKSGALLRIIDVREDEDLALLKGEASMRPLTIRDGRAVRLAEDLLVAGFPLGGILSSGINVTVGTVSALAGLGDDEARFQFTAPVQPGNSGGPVLDMSGNVIGVVVSKLDAMSVQKETGDIPQNVNFGITLPHLTAFLDENKVGYKKQASAAKMDKVDLAERARESTVLLQCYQ
jgi:S1-C subfamily serine protease